MRRRRKAGISLRQILLIDDEALIAELLTAKYAGEAEVVVATRANEARAVFSRRNDWDVIVIDGDLNDGTSMPDLVREFRQTYQGPMVAASGNGELQKQLLAAGCDHDGRKPNTAQAVDVVMAKLR